MGWLRVCAEAQFRRPHKFRLCCYMSRSWWDLLGHQGCTFQRIMQCPGLSFMGTPSTKPIDSGRTVVTFCGWQLHKPEMILLKL